MVRLLGSALLLCVTHLGLAQPFGEPESNPFGIIPVGQGALELPNGFDFTDLDNDGDHDLLLFHQEGGGIYYYEQLICDGHIQFSAPLKNPYDIAVPEPGFLAYHTFVACDIDGDLDQDLLLGDLMRPFLLLENTGSQSQPQYAEARANPYYLEDGSLRPHAFGDVDNDGDLDVLTTVYLGGKDSKICLLQNQGSTRQPDFLMPGDLDLLGDGMLGLGNGDFADMDGDGDKDYLHAEVDGNLTFHENLGIEGEIAFGPEQVNPWGFAKLSENNSTVRLVDIDRDGDLDYFEMDLFTGKLYFRENLAPVVPDEVIPGVVRNIELLSSANGSMITLTLELADTAETISLRILDAEGRVFATTDLIPMNNQAAAEIDLQSLSGGTYLLELRTELGNYQQTLVKTDP